ncbi:MAG: hypothetical protein R6U10_00310 [Thermoplasmatota archaeon]
MKRVLVLLAVFLFVAPGATACKDIIAAGDATAGDYNLLLKVRDPSRPGLQVLTMVNESYRYTYHTPWLGRDMTFTTDHKYIGVATKGDVPPDVVKPGMALSQAGIAYGDADLPSYWRNPSPHAWDDFDWIRYACQTATAEQQAVDMLVHAVEDMHAPGVPENLFVVGPGEAYLIEGTAVHYNVQEVHGVAVRSNYPRQLWDSMILKRLFVAPTFDSSYEGDVRRGRTVRLGSLLGVRLLSVDDDGVTVRQTPLGDRIAIAEGEGATVGFFRVNVIDAGGNTARLLVRYRYAAWEDEMTRRVQASYGDITPHDMMEWSRLHSSDLEGMRGMCEDQEKGAMVYKIPRQGYETLSMGWFAPDQCSAIYVPVHIADTTIYEPYRSGSAASLAVQLLQRYGHGGITDACRQVERVFLRENDAVEALAVEADDDAVAEVLTTSDVEMQRQAYLMQNAFLIAGTDQRDAIAGAWNHSYVDTLENLRDSMRHISGDVAGILVDVAASIARARVSIAATVTGDQRAMDRYREGKTLAGAGSYSDAIQRFIEAYDEAQSALHGGRGSGSVSEEERRNDLAAVAVGVILACIVLLVVVRRRW